MKYSKNKDIHKIVKRLIQEFGWVIKSKNNHLRLWHEGKRRSLTVPQTPSDGRALLNFTADVRRLGFDV